MGLAAAELGLHAEHRGHVLAGEAVADLHQGGPEVLRKKSLLGEQLRVQVVARASARGHEAQVGSEEGLIERTVSDVVVRRRHLQPGLQLHQDTLLMGFRIR